MAALLSGACFLAPDRVYTEIGTNPIADVDSRSTLEVDDYVFTVGVEYDLQPVESPLVVRDDMLLEGLNTLSLAVQQKPPLVHDDELKKQLLNLHTAILALVESNAQLAEDVSSMRETINNTLRGGGGLTVLLSILAGGRHVARRRKLTEEEPV